MFYYIFLALITLVQIIHSAQEIELVNFSRGFHGLQNIQLINYTNNRLSYALFASNNDDTQEPFEKINSGVVGKETTIDLCDNDISTDKKQLKLCIYDDSGKQIIENLLTKETALQERCKHLKYKIKHNPIIDPYTYIPFLYSPYIRF